MAPIHRATNVSSTSFASAMHQRKRDMLILFNSNHEGSSMARKVKTVLQTAALLVLIGGGIECANAVPSYARQTGQECIACHVSFPELTPYGRYFKLTGYTIGKTAITAEGINYA